MRHQSSHETVARALTLLRLTRWIGPRKAPSRPQDRAHPGQPLCPARRTSHPYEAIQLDVDYLELVSQSLAHASKSIQRVGVHTLREMIDDPLLSGRELPSRLQVISQRLAAQGWTEAATYPQVGYIMIPKKGKTAFFGIVAHPLRNPKWAENVENRLTSESEDR